LVNKKTAFQERNKETKKKKKSFNPSTVY